MSKVQILFQFLMNQDEHMQKKLEIERELFLTPQFELIDGFTVYSQPASARIDKIRVLWWIDWIGNCRINYNDKFILSVFR